MELKGQTLSTVISADEALQLLASPRPPLALDFRSESEFSVSPVPGFISAPILTDQERHLVGSCYKSQGQDAAIRLGHELVGPHRERRVQQWIELLLKEGLKRLSQPAADSGQSLAPGSSHIVLLACWRGGLRSRIATEWVVEGVRQILCDPGSKLDPEQKAFLSKVRFLRVEGGTKALRGGLLLELENHPELVVLAGMTGSGKTLLLHELSGLTRLTGLKRQLGIYPVDLEGLANHRGSSFGRPLTTEQPSQTSFENQLALRWMQARRVGHPVLLEDESLMIGRLHLPSSLKEKMRRSPVVLLRVPQEERIKNIAEEYVFGPIRSQFEPEQLLMVLTDSLERLKTRLGGLRTKQLQDLMETAFQRSQWSRLDAELDSHLGYHAPWIERLLEEYYDNRYLHAMKRQERRILFEGDYPQCLTFLSQLSDLHRQ